MKLYDSIPDDIRDWAVEQPVFFTASAPLNGQHINCSPKGLPSSSFTIFDANHCAYLDATGSSAETIAHCYENGRITIMFCSFGTMPRILRLFCRGTVIEHDSEDFEPALRRMGVKRHEGSRAVVMLEVWKVQTSCGKSVPVLSGGDPNSPEVKNGLAFEDRYDLHRWAEGMDQRKKLTGYREQNNAFSNDGLPSMKLARRGLGRSPLQDEVEAFYRRGLNEKAGLLMGFVACLLLLLISRIVGHAVQLDSILPSLKSATMSI